MQSELNRLAEALAIEPIEDVEKFIDSVISYFHILKATVAASNVVLGRLISTTQAACNDAYILVQAYDHDSKPPNEVVERARKYGEKNETGSD